MLLCTSTPATADRLDAALGKALFDRPWVSSPSSARATDGLGPLYNARACASCHRDGGGARGAIGLVARLAPDVSDVYGRQLQTAAVAGLRGEGRLDVTFSARPFAFADGARVTLWQPRYRTLDPGYGPLDSAALRPRLSPPLYGVALFERVADAALLDHADPHDADADGISGRAHRIRANDRERIGRYGWKAERASLAAQIADAFSIDMGLSTPLRPDHAGDCTPRQRRCRNAPHGNDPERDDVEIPARLLVKVGDYLRALTPPVPKHTGTTSSDGKRLFSALGCAACHRPRLPLAEVGVAIAPYSDLLLHDMGELLADPATDDNITQRREWRTAPLWGTARRTQWLHDGRARSLTEAILWHGGEAESARTRFSELKKTDRQRLLGFLRKL